MTVREKLEKMLYDCGLWPADARAIFDFMLERDSDGVYKTIQWSDPIEGEGAYPKQLLAGIWLDLQCHAANWLAEHKPQHFARAMFLKSQSS